MSFNYRLIGKVSCVAAIVHGETVRRIVVTYPENVQFHVSKPGERAVIIPNLWVQEPVGWVDIPVVIQMAKDHVAGK